MQGVPQSFEYLVLRTSAPAECPHCKSADLEQLISACAVSSESTQQANLSAAHRKVGSPVAIGYATSINTSTSTSKTAALVLGTRTRITR